MISRVNRSQEMLATVLDPADRMWHLHRDRGDSNFFGQKAILPTEAATDIWCDDADLVLGQTEGLGQAQPHDMRPLGREVDHQLVQPVIPIRHYAPAFQSYRRLPIHPELPAQPYGGPREGSRVAIHHAALDEGVVRPMLKEPNTFGPHSRNAIGYGR